LVAWAGVGRASNYKGHKGTLGTDEYVCSIV